MNSIDAMMLEIKLQTKGELARVTAKPSIEPVIFIGSGDSYAAGLAAQSVSSGRSRCYTPSELLAFPDLLTVQELFFVSASGKTTGNIEASLLARGHGLKTTAITRNRDSPLAHHCDKTIELEYRTSGIVTAGSLAFTAAMLTCCNIAAGKVVSSEKISKVYESASEQTADFMKLHMPEKRGPVLFLAPPLLYPLSMYAAFKQFEVLGKKSSFYSIEEFCHSPIFGLQGGETVVIFGSDDKSLALRDRLLKAGVASWALDIGSLDVLESALACAFFAQMLALAIAEKNGLRECYFLSNKSLLDISSSMIY